MTKKNKIILASLGLILLVLVFVFIRLIAPANKISSQPTSGAVVPEFMTAQEKAKLGLPPELKAQIINRNGSGDITVYKVIKSDQDIVADPNKISPINPPQETPAR